MKKRTIIVIVFVVGSFYGLVSAIVNRNPYYSIPKQGVAEADMAKAWEWEPSELWLPSYVLCKMAKHSGGNWAGVTYTKSGYIFRTRSDFGIYFIASIIIGGVAGVLLGCMVKAAVREVQAKTKAAAPIHSGES